MVDAAELSILASEWPAECAEQNVDAHCHDDVTARDLDRRCAIGLARRGLVTWLVNALRSNLYRCKDKKQHYFVTKICKFIFVIYFRIKSVRLLLERPS